MLAACLKFVQKMPFYAVARGKKVGVFQTWPECESQVKGFANAAFKKFNTEQEAKEFITANKNGSSTSTFSRKNLSKKTTSSLVTNMVANNGATKRTISVQAAHIKQKKSKIDEAATNEFTASIVKLVQHGKYEFMEDSDGYVHVYTDGSCENNGRVNAVAGFGVYFGEGHALNKSKPVVGPATNNRGEIQAVTQAIQDASEHGVRKLCINSDSHFVINSVTKWMKSWKARGWRLANGGPVKNIVDFQALDHAIRDNQQLEIKWNYVPAHVGIRGNERADELAKLGATFYRSA